MSKDTYNTSQRLTRAQKEADDKHWYKEQLRHLNKISFSKITVSGVGRPIVSFTIDFLPIKFLTHHFTNIFS